eukprot:scaffold3154_cov105-Pinguiococcus_pyrenoidosus.AAC.1
MPIPSSQPSSSAGHSWPSQSGSINGSQGVATGPSSSIGHASMPTYPTSPPGTTSSSKEVAAPFLKSISSGRAASLPGMPVQPTPTTPSPVSNSSAFA